VRYKKTEVTSENDDSQSENEEDLQLFIEKESFENDKEPNQNKDLDKCSKWFKYKDNS